MSSGVSSSSSSSDEEEPLRAAEMQNQNAVTSAIELGVTVSGAPLMLDVGSSDPALSNASVATVASSNSQVLSEDDDEEDEEEYYEDDEESEEPHVIHELSEGAEVEDVVVDLRHEKQLIDHAPPDDFERKPDDRISLAESVFSDISMALQSEMDAAGMDDEDSDSDEDNSPENNQNTLLSAFGPNDVAQMFDWNQQSAGVSSVISMLQRRERSNQTDKSLGEEVSSSIRLELLKKYLIQTQDDPDWGDLMTRICIAFLGKAASMIEQRDRHMNRSHKRGKTRKLTATLGNIQSGDPTPMKERKHNTEMIMMKGLSREWLIRDFLGDPNTPKDSNHHRANGDDAGNVPGLTDTTSAGKKAGHHKRNSSILSRVSLISASESKIPLKRALTVDEIIEVLKKDSRRKFGDSHRPWMELRKSGTVRRLIRTLKEITVDSFQVRFEQDHPRLFDSLRQTIESDVLISGMVIRGTGASQAQSADGNALGMETVSNLDQMVSERVNQLFILIRDVMVGVVESRANVSIHPMVHIPRILNQPSGGDVKNLGSLSPLARTLHALEDKDTLFPVSPNQFGMMSPSTEVLSDNEDNVHATLGRMNTLNMTGRMTLQQKKSWCNGFRLTKLLQDVNGAVVLDTLSLLTNLNENRIVEEHSSNDTGSNGSRRVSNAVGTGLAAIGAGTYKTMTCDGCGQSIVLADYTKHLHLYYSRSTETPFLFHDEYCVHFRKLKESVRLFLVHTEIAANMSDFEPPAKLSDDILLMLKMKNSIAMATGQELPRPTPPSTKSTSFSSVFNLSKSVYSRTVGAAGKVGKSVTTMVGAHSSSNSVENSVDGKTDLYPKKNILMVDVPDFINDTMFLRERIVCASHSYWKERIAKQQQQQLQDAPPSLLLSSKQLKKKNMNVIDLQYQNMPLLLREMDVFTYGPSMWAYCVLELQAKDRPALWACLNHLACLLPTQMCIALLEEHKRQLSKFDMEMLDLLCQAVIQTSLFPAAVALYLAAFMKELAEQDLSRTEKFESAQEKYIQSATDLLQQIESDHLLAIIMEIPSEIDSMSIYDISLKYGLDTFLDFHRLTPVMTQMWYNYEFLNPSKPFPQLEKSNNEILQMVWDEPAKFYYAPVGQYITSSVLYISYLIFLSYVSWERTYPYEKVGFLEYLLWIFNIGQVSFELTQAYFEGYNYWSEVSNWWDASIMCLWVILFIMRFGIIFAIFPRSWVERYDSNSNDSDNSDDEINEQKSRNTTFVSTYMVIWGLNLIFLWTRVTLVFLRSKSLAAMVRMVGKMVADIANFAVILLVLTLGFVFALHYMISQDVEEDCTEESSMGDFFSVSLFIFQTLLGQQDWATVDAGNTECMTNYRIRSSTLLIAIYSIIGSLLLLNLLIAIMATTYDSVSERAALEVNFARIQHTVELNYSFSLMSPPFNVIVFIFSLGWFAADSIIFICSAGYFELNSGALYPLRTYSLKMDSEEEKLFQRREESLISCCVNTKRDADSEAENAYNDDDTSSSKMSLCSYFCRVPRMLWRRFVSRHFDQSSAKCCRYCRHEMMNEAGGDIDAYFELFRAHQLLDEADKSLMRTLLRGQTVCEYCFRPYKQSHRFHRWQVTLEIMSYYVFLSCVSVLVFIFLLIPAMASKLSHIISSGLLSSEQSNATVMAEDANLAMDIVDVEYSEQVGKVLSSNNRKFDDENDEDETDTADLLAIQRGMSRPGMSSALGSTVSYIPMMNPMASFDPNLAVIQSETIKMMEQWQTARQMAADPRMRTVLNNPQRKAIPPDPSKDADLPPPKTKKIKSITPATPTDQLDLEDDVPLIPGSTPTPEQDSSAGVEITPPAPVGSAAAGVPGSDQLGVPIRLQDIRSLSTPVPMSLNSPSAEITELTRLLRMVNDNVQSLNDRLAKVESQLSSSYQE